MRAVVIVAVLAVAWAAGEWWAQQAAADRVAEEVAAASDDVVTADAEVGSFPLVTRTLLTGTIDDVAIEITELRGGTVPVDRLTIELEEVTLDRSALLGGNADITAIGSGRFDALIGIDGLPGPARTALRAAGVVIEALDARLTEAGLELDIPLAGTLTIGLPLGVIPACDPAVTVEGDALVVRCTFTELPDAFRT